MHCCGTFSHYLRTPAAAAMTPALRSGSLTHTAAQTRRLTSSSSLWRTATTATQRRLQSSSSSSRSLQNSVAAACRRRVRPRRGRANPTARRARPLQHQLQRFSSLDSSSLSTTTATTSTSTTASLSNTTAAAAAAGEGQAPQQLSWQAVRALFVASAVPMVGFGFMDNLVMIQAGQYIDSTLGVKFGLATMTAAACGQVVSDVSGVLFGGTVEAFINRWMPNPIAATLSTAQRQSLWGRYASLSGAVIGVTIGCALGATTLFFVDLDARDRIQRAGQFKEVLSDMTQQAAHFPCREVVVHVAVKAHQRYDWQSLNQNDGPDSSQSSSTSSSNGAAPQVRLQSLDLLGPESDNDWAVQAARQQEILVRGPRVFAPIRHWDDDKDDEIWAVVEFVKDRSDISTSTAKTTPGDQQDEEEEGVVVVSESDVKKVQVMASHLAIFMHRIAD